MTFSVFFIYIQRFIFYCTVLNGPALKYTLVAVLRRALFPTSFHLAIEECVGMIIFISDHISTA